MTTKTSKTSKTSPAPTPDPLDVANVAAELAAAMDAARTASMAPEMHPYASDDFEQAIAELEQYGRFNTTEGDDLARFGFTLVHTVEQDARRIMATSDMQFRPALDKVRRALTDACAMKDNVIRRVTLAFGADRTQEPDAPHLIFIALPSNSWGYAVKGWSVVAVAYWPDVRTVVDWRTVEALTGLTRDEVQAEVAAGNEPLTRCTLTHTTEQPGWYNRPGFLGYAATFTDYDEGEAAAIACSRAVDTIRAASATRATDEEGAGETEQPAPTYRKRSEPAI